MTRRQEIAMAICLHGLRMAPRQLSATELAEVGRWTDRIIAAQGGVPTREIVEAIRHGMPRVWPFSEDGRSFDARDVYRNITKAKGAAAVLRKAGRIPMPAKEVSARFKRMVAEHHEEEA